MQRSFISELKHNHIDNIVELNDLFAGWLKYEYHDKVHSSLGVTPKQKWEQSKNRGARLHYFSPVEIDEAFLHYTVRTVSKYGTISFEGNSYEVDGTLVGKEIGLRYDPFHLEQVHIYYEDKYYGLARVIDLTKQKHRDVEKIEKNPIVTSQASIQYFDNIKSNYQKYLQKQLGEPIEIIDNQVKTSKSQKQKENETLPKVPDEKTEVIKRKEFVNIIVSSLNMDNLSFAQKGKLYQLWQTFKEFNPDYLTSIIDDIKEKTPDYNHNFLYYLTQIKNLYLEKLNEKTKGGQTNDT